MLPLTLLESFNTSNPEINAWPDVGFSRVVNIMMVVLFPAPFGPKRPKISPGLTEKEMPSTATASPNDFLSDLVSIEYNESDVFINYKLLSIWPSVQV